MKTKILLMAALTVGLFWACQTDGVELNVEDALKEIPMKEPIFREIGNTAKPISVPGESNALLKSSKNFELAIYMAEYITAGNSEEMGNIFFFIDTGNKQLGADFVPGMSIDGSDQISYYVDESRPSLDVDVTTSTDAIDRAMQTWDEVTCSDLGITKFDFNAAYPQTGFVANFLGFGGSSNYFGDVLHAGWLPPEFFNTGPVFPPDGADYILGVTFTIIFTENGQPVDTDKNGKADVAWRETYYNDAFPWNDGADFDIETIALHESGHGLSQAHFGKAFGTYGNGKIHFAPRALMNAAYTGIQTTITKTDNAGHCSNWAQWPKN